MGKTTGSVQSVPYEVRHRFKGLIADSFIDMSDETLELDGNKELDDVIADSFRDTPDETVELYGDDDFDAVVVDMGLSRPGESSLTMRVLRFGLPHLKK